MLFTETLRHWLNTVLNCQFHATKAPAAPIQGHLTTDYPGKVFSHYAMCVIVPDLKSTTIATIPLPTLLRKDTATTAALRDDILKHAWDRPEKWVCDGASYFKAECRAGIDAWAGALRVSGAHHAESHDIIERHNQTYLGILKCFGNETNWR